LNSREYDERRKMCQTTRPRRPNSGGGADHTSAPWWWRPSPSQWRSRCLEQPSQTKNSTTIIMRFIFRRERHRRIQLLLPFAPHFPPLQSCLRRPKQLSCFRRCKRRKRLHYQIAVLRRAVSLTIFETLADLGAKFRVVENLGPYFAWYGWCIGLC
jgi:hypothetical protein